MKSISTSIPALFCSTAEPPRRPRVVDDVIGSIDESKTLGELVYVRPRETFCKVTRAIVNNDEAFVFGCPGAATDHLILTMELERLEKNRLANINRRLT